MDCRKRCANFSIIDGASVHDRGPAFFNPSAEIPDHGQPQQGYDPHIHIEQKLLCCTDTAAPAFCTDPSRYRPGNVISFPCPEGVFPGHPAKTPDF